VAGPSVWSEEHGPWPPPDPPGFVARIKRPIVRAAAAWGSPDDPSDGIAILAYHATDPDRQQHRWIDFRGQMSLLDDLGFEVVTLTTAVERIGSGRMGDRPAVAITFDDGWASNLDVAFPELARRGWPASVFLTSSFIGRRPFLNEAEVRGLRDMGVEPELHTDTHPDLTTVGDAAIVEEIERCRRRIEELTQHRPKFFCYPFGYLDRRVRDAVAGAGVDAACTGIPGRNRPGQDLLLLRRITPDCGDGPRDLAAGLAGGTARLASLRAFLGARNPSVHPHV